MAVAPLAARAAGAGVYDGPLVDAHSHLPSAGAIDAYVAAMGRHRVDKVVLLGVGGLQDRDDEWIAAAARAYPDRVVPGLRLADPVADGAATRLERALAQRRPPALGEVHLRQVSRKIDRSPTSPAFLAILEVAGAHGVPVVIHYELTDPAATALGRALDARPKAVVVLAHGGEGPPGRVEGLLARHANLMVDLSGMHFDRRPALASESGPVDAGWKALVEKMPERFLIGVDVWAPRLFAPAMLDRLLRWTRRVLGELSPAVAERVAHRNAGALFRLG